MPFENFDSIKPLGYTGINPEANPGVIKGERAPTTADNARIGTIWVDTTSNAVYALSSISSGAANWEVLGSPTAAVSQIDGDSGSAVPAAGVININGGTGIDVTASGSTVTTALNEAIPQQATASLTSAEVKALRATPIEIIAAPGAGKVIEFIGATLKLVYGGSNAFTETDDNVAFKYTDGSGLSVSGNIESTGFIDQTASTYTSAVRQGDGIVAATGAENQALVLHNTGDGEIAGNAANDNTLEISVLYRVVSI